jgi:outer membrane protein TolC
MPLIRVVFFTLLAFVTVQSSLLLAGEESDVPAWTAERAVDFALQNNPDSRISRIRLTAAQAKIDQADSRLHPQLRLNTEYSQTDNPLYSFGNILNQGSFDSSIDFNDPGRTDNFKIQAELQYRLYNGGKNRAAIALSEYDLQRYSADYAAVLNQLAFEVVRSFQQIVLAEEMVEARKSALQAITLSRRIAQARHEAGDLLRQHLLDLEVQEALAGEDLIQARHTLNLAHHGFNNLLGLANRPVRIDRNSSSPQHLPELLDFSARPELNSAEHAVAAAGAALKMSRAESFPAIDGFAGYQYDNGFITGGDGDSWIAGVRLSYSLFDGGLRAADVAEKNALLATRKEQKRKMELQLDFELQQARQELQQTEQRVAVTMKMVRLARESARLSRARFKEGLLLSSELIDIETRLTDAMVRDSRAQALHRLAIANLRKIVGLPQFSN